MADEDLAAADDDMARLLGADPDLTAGADPKGTYHDAALKSFNERGVIGEFRKGTKELVYPFNPQYAETAYKKGAAGAIQKVINTLEGIVIDVKGVTDGPQKASKLTLEQLNNEKVIMKLFNDQYGILHTELELSNSQISDFATYLRSVSRTSGLDGIGAIKAKYDSKKKTPTEKWFHFKQRRSRDVVDFAPGFDKHFFQVLSQGQEKGMNRMTQLWGALKFTTGMRMEEMAKLTVDNLKDIADPDFSRIFLPEVKTGGSSRIVITDIAREVANEILHEREKYMNLKSVREGGKIFPHGASKMSSDFVDAMRGPLHELLGEGGITKANSLDPSDTEPAKFQTKMLRNNFESKVGEFSGPERRMLTGRATLSEADKYITTSANSSIGKNAANILQSRIVGQSDFVSPVAFLNALGITDFIGDVPETIDPRALTNERELGPLSTLTRKAIDLIPSFGSFSNVFSPTKIGTGEEWLPTVGEPLHAERGYNALKEISTDITTTLQKGLGKVSGQMDKIFGRLNELAETVTKTRGPRAGGAGGAGGAGRGGALKIPAGATLTADDVLRSGESINWSKSNFSREDILKIRQAAVSRDPERVQEAITQATSNSRSDYKKTVQKLLEGVKEGSSTALKTLDNIAKSDTGRGIIGLAAYLASFTGALGKAAVVGKKALLGETVAEVGIQSVLEPGSIGSKTSGDITQLSQDELLQKMQSARDAEGGSEYEYGRFGETYGASEVMGGQPLEGISPAPGARTQGFATMPGTFSPDIATPWNPLTPLPKQKVSHQQLLEEEATGRYMEDVRDIESSAASEEARKYELMSGAPPPEHIEEFGQQMTEGFAQSKQEALEQDKTPFMKEYEDYFKHMRY